MFVIWLVCMLFIMLCISVIAIFEKILVKILKCFFFFCFKQKTAYEMRIIVCSSDVCSSDLVDFYPGNMKIYHESLVSAGWEFGEVELFDLFQLEGDQRLLCLLEDLLPE